MLILFEGGTSNQAIERVEDVGSGLSTHFQVAHVPLFRKHHGYVVRHFSIGEVAFVAYQHNDHTAVNVVGQLLKPDVKLVKALLLCDIVHEYCTDGLAEE